MSDLRVVRRALLSVTDKTGLVAFGRGLAAAGVDLVSTGGTATALREAGLPVRDISELTKFPEMLSGRVKTLHPAVHGGILHRRGVPEHVAAVEAHGIQPIDMVVVNLYAFETTAAKPGVELEELIENIDIGGPSMLRSAAKNHEDVAVVSSAGQYDAVLRELRESEGALSGATRWALARAAFATTAAYDGAIARTLETRATGEGGAGAAGLSTALRSGREDGEGGAGFADLSTALRSGREDGEGGAGAAGLSTAVGSGREDGEQEEGALPAVLRVEAPRRTGLRYGENPHQRAALYTDGSGRGIANGEQLWGKELSFNNLVDLDACWALAQEFDQTAVAIIKHTNPCGVATGASVAEAYGRALAADPVSAFGGVIGVNREVDGAAAAEMAKLFVEAIVAPGFTPEAMEALAAKKNLRVVRVQASEPGLVVKSVSGGFLAQTEDAMPVDAASYRVVTERKPTEAEMTALLFAWRVSKHVKSNAIVYARVEGGFGQSVGVGAGQMSRVDAARFGAMKAALPLEGTVAASDAFFPFADGLEVVAKAGATAVIQPGGSVRDAEVIAAADRLGVAMVMTGTRHFRHG